MSDASYLEFDAIVVGAGIAGLYMAYQLSQRGYKVRVLERADGVGGTWYWNRYPGARCDVESLEYSYTFSEELQQEWEWSERYAGQPEILRYVNHVADRFSLRKYIEFGAEVAKAEFDERDSRWVVHTANGTVYTGNFLVMATGCLSSTNTPDIDGIDDFQGNVYHTGEWPHGGVDFSGQAVGIVGTGSSAIQAIPHIARECGELTVFQRTPNYSVPARNGPIDKRYEAKVKSNYAGFRAKNRMMPAALGGSFPGTNVSALDVSQDERNLEFHKRWDHGGFAFLGAFNDLGISRESNDCAAEFVRDRIRDAVAESEVAEALIPDSVIGCKRLCLDTQYFETYNLEHVHLVDIRKHPIVRLTSHGIECSHRSYEFDSVVFATGFDAMTGTLLRINLRGRNRISLNESWKEGPKTFLGLTTVGFPNMFMISGPGSPSVLTNMIVSIEQHVEWIADCMDHMQRTGVRTIEPTVEVQDDWVTYVNAIADMTLYPRCNSWYLGANIPGKPRVFMPHVGYPNYVKRCEDVVANDYQGFVLQ